VPQAYPQIANALETLASNIPAEINLPVEKGYALATDVWKKVAIVCGALGVIGVVTWAINEWVIRNDTVKRIVEITLKLAGLCASILRLREGLRKG
jgi:hypothetical protein